MFFTSLELNADSVSAIAFFSLILFLMVGGYRKVGHQGQIPMWIGGFLIIGSLIALLGSTVIQFDCNNESANCDEGKKSWFELAPRDQAFSLIGLGLGFFFLFIGLKQAGGAAYYWGNIKKG